MSYCIEQGGTCCCSQSSGIWQCSQPAHIWLAWSELLHGVAVTELVQAAAQPSGRVQALPTGPPLLCRAHLPGAQGSTAATAVVTGPPRRLCCPVSRPSVRLAGKSQSILALLLNSCLTCCWKPNRAQLYWPPTHLRHPSTP